MRVLVCGANGKMGRSVLQAVMQDDQLQLVGAVDREEAQEDMKNFFKDKQEDVCISSNLKQALVLSKAEVMVDFTNPSSVKNNAHIAIEVGVSPIIGTTGLNLNDLEELGKQLDVAGIGGLVAPNFAIGAILLMKFAQEAVQYLPNVEIIELHHDQKLDAPSGTALRTASLMLEQRDRHKQGHSEEEEKISGARGADMGGIRIHSVRLPGYVAHEEVIFGGLGQTLTLKHDSISRESFMPGVVLACKKVRQTQGLTVGLEHYLK